MPKPVLFVPGLPGSHLYDQAGGGREHLFLSIWRLIPKPVPSVLRRLEGPDDLVAGDSVVAGMPIKKAAKFLFFDLAKQAKSLYDILDRVGVDPVGFGWDWRRPIWDAPLQQRLKHEVERLHQQHGQNVVVIVHSTGGLVLRHLLEHAPASFLDKIERVIAFGVPWAGTLKSLGYLAGQKGFGTISAPKSQKLIAHSWAAFDLLPPDPTKTQMVDQHGARLDLAVDGSGRQISPLIKRGWFDPRYRAAMVFRADGADREIGTRSASLRLAGGRVIPVTNVVGWGGSTVVQAAITGSGNQQQVRLQSTTGDQVLGGGDETIPRVSAAWLRGAGVSTYHLPIGVDHGAEKAPHSILWQNPGGRNLLRHLVGGRPLGQFAYGAVDEEDFIEGPRVRLRLVALDAAGQPLPGAGVRTLDLHSGTQLDQPFDLGFEGRHLMSIPRSRIRKVHGNRLRRFEVEIGWQGGRQRRAYVIQKG